MCVFLDVYKEIIVLIYKAINFIYATCGKSLLGSMYLLVVFPCFLPPVCKDFRYFNRIVLFLRRLLDFVVDRQPYILPLVEQMENP